MDNTSITHLSLCSGYGGIDLGLKRVVSNLRTVAYCERESSAVELLLSRMESGHLDPAPIWSDLKSFPWGAFSGRVDILSGGYPCQPFSAAGKRLGADDERHIWPAIADGIRILRPRMCFFENVEGHISLGLREVVAELEGLGYRTTWGIFSAAEVGAPHQRKRVFIMAYREGAGLEGYDGLLARCGESGRHAPQPQGQVGGGDSGRDAWPSRPGEQQFWWEPPRVVDDTGGEEQCGLPDWAGREEVATTWQSGAGQHQQETQSQMGGDVARTASWVGYAKLCISSDNRTDELRMLGNGVVPATAAKAFETLMKELNL